MPVGTAKGLQSEVYRCFSEYCLNPPAYAQPFLEV
jgi:hypothetical protein